MFNAKVFYVMIASPADVLEERQIVRDIVIEWTQSTLKKWVLF